MNSPQADIERILAQELPAVEVLLVEQSGDVLRLYIDHPDGVSLTVCEQVTHALASVRERYALEVSSPGPKRPLTKPEHYRRFVGRRARLRCNGVDQSTVTGELVGATEREVTIAATEGLMAIPYTAITRSHLVEE
jgi:ribosome maturation factor RimP